MVMFDSAHIGLLIGTVAFLAISTLVVSKLPRMGQNIAFFMAALYCAGGIFFRYGMNLSFAGGFNFKTLGTQMLQVCNFNFILVLLMLIPKFELARQYSVFFSAAAACTTFVSISSAWKNYEWNDLTVLNSWFNHVFAVALPLWMVAARRLKPQKKYIPWVLCLVFIYFTAAYILNKTLIDYGILAPGTSFSFIYDAGKVGLLEMLQGLIPYPYFYLYPLFPVLAGFCWVWAKAFEKYKVEKFHY